MFTKKPQEESQVTEVVFETPPTPKEVAKIQAMLRQLETWIEEGDAELAKEHWMLISNECRKHGT